MANIYCGNNALHPDLVNGTKILGSRYQCLRKGVGTGLNLPFDPDYGGPYAPIDNRRIYCGNAVDLPDGYDSMGNLAQCLQRGVGIGKLQRAQEEDDDSDDSDDSEDDSGLHTDGSFKKKKHSNILLYVIVAILVFIFLYLIKPSFVSFKDENNKVQINWKIFIFYYALIVFMIWILILMIFK
jgi:hypothetical protein